MPITSKRVVCLVSAGAILILLGLFSNPRVLASFLSPDKRIESSLFKLTIYALQLGSIILGIILILKRNYFASNIKNILINLTLFSTSILITFIIIEGTLRIFKIAPPRNPEWFSKIPTLFEYHPVFGWQFIPNKTCRVTTLYNKQVSIGINSAGIRDREYSLEKPPGKTRIVVLGDSFTSGLEVNSEELFTEIMERSLNNCEVLNFGINGFGPAQEFLILKEKAISYQPDLVLMVIYLRNDFDDLTEVFNWAPGYQRPRVVLEEGEIVFKNIPVPPPPPKKVVRPPKVPYQQKVINFINRIFTSLHLVRFIQERITNITQKDVFNKIPPEVRLLKKDALPEIKKASLLMKELIKEIFYFTQKRKIKFGVVIAPGIVQVYPERYWNEIKAQYHLRDEDYELMLLNNFLKKLSNKLGIPCLDLTPSLRAEARAGRELYYHKCHHWNESGHQVVAQALVNFLKSQHLVRN